MLSKRIGNKGIGADFLSQFIGSRELIDSLYEKKISPEYKKIIEAYADGLNRKLGDGKGKVLIDGKACSILGQVSMDSFVADVSGTNAQEGDQVTIFSNTFSI